MIALVCLCVYMIVAAAILLLNHDDNTLALGWPIIAICYLFAFGVIAIFTVIEFIINFFGDLAVRCGEIVTGPFRD
jgi:hypothetical protein